MFREAIIRPLFLGDAPILQRISAEARARYRAIPALAHVAVTPPVELERFESGSGWVAESEGEILGYALSKPVDNLLFLDNISTREEAKGMGIGKKLLEMFLMGAAKDGFDTVALTTFRSPPWNGPWFRRFGFLPIPEAAIGPNWPRSSKDRELIWTRSNAKLFRDLSLLLARDRFWRILAIDAAAVS